MTLRHPDREGELFARVKVPQVLPPWVRVDAGEPGAHRVISLIELIRHNLKDLFPDMAITDVMTFRITRNADVERDEEDADDLLEMVEDEIRRRRFERASDQSDQRHPGRRGDHGDDRFARSRWPGSV